MSVPCLPARVSVFFGGLTGHEYLSRVVYRESVVYRYPYLGLLRHQRVLVENAEVAISWRGSHYPSLPTALVVPPHPSLYFYFVVCTLTL